MADPPDRPDPDWSADERTLLVQFLDYQRTTLERQVFGITDAQAATASVEPSMLTLTGLVRHMHDVERNWLRRRFRGEVVDPEYYSEAHPDGDLEVDPSMSVARAVAAWRAEVAISDEIIAGADLDQIAVSPSRSGGLPSMRWILLHLIEEYARHCGHADLIRERIDGATDL